ncbi:SURF1 family protein [Aquibium sp. A9E412]|uniref:SURF1 family protein n=1 Tax=Aquibium sp. A9E412 TaxID=2976767 RepID=UPI0025AF5D8A|nr:SURF1 family protein [Aquibium sp. A9E412]MDN2566818.1 SURF1 family protein [Aquibium sp. A9E412]
MTDPARSAAADGRRVWLVLAAAGVMLVVLLGLGTWQVQRLAWKEALIARVDARVAQPPVALADLAARLGEPQALDYTPVRLAGRFLHEREMYVLATEAGQSGWHVYTPLVLDRAAPFGDTVIVNRGFVPYDRRDPATRPGSQPEGTVAIEGLARSAPRGKPGALVPDNAPADGTYYWKEWPAMVRAAALDPADTVPFFVDAGPGGAAALPVGGVTRIAFPNSHLQYAITWYGLALALVAVVFVWLRGSRAGRG